MLKKSLTRSILILIVGVIVTACESPTQPLAKSSTSPDFRAPAYPLITIDPYTSAWSMSDNLYDSPVRHWTGKTHSLIGAIRVDGKT